MLDYLAETRPGNGMQIYDVLKQVRQLSRSAAHVMVISTRGAPFLTSGGDWQTAARPEGPQRIHAELTWIDCRSEALRQYFVATGDDTADQITR